MSSAQQTLERAARESYGRLLAWLSARCSDVSLAEDCLGDALEAALRQWPETGVPRAPEAWLLTAARRRLIDSHCREGMRGRAEDDVRRAALERLQRDALEAQDVPFRDNLPDRRLGLLFVCAHPEVPRELRAPLMLQTVLGLDAARIGSSMLVAPATIAQRLVRVKRRLRETAPSFEVPSPEELPARLKDVLEGVYAAYGADADLQRERLGGLAHEAIWLAQLLVQQLSDEPEVWGLYALLCYCESRRDARWEGEEFVPLDEQDPARWDASLLDEADRALRIAASKRRGGPFQVEAAIHSLHADRARTGVTDWERVHQMYAVLVDEYPSLGGWVGYAASLGRVGRAADGIAVLDRLEPQRVARYQPYWAVRAWLLALVGADATEAYERAIGLCEHPAVRRWLMRRRDGTA